MDFEYLSLSFGEDMYKRSLLFSKIYLSCLCTLATCYPPGVSRYLISFSGLFKFSALLKGLESLNGLITSDAEASHSDADNAHRQ